MAMPEPPDVDPIAATDLDVLRAMLTRAGVIFTEEARTQDPAHPYLADVPAGTTLEVEEGSDRYAEDDHGVTGEPPRPRNYGYSGFSAEFYFDAYGALVGVGAWE
jgi:hypothetical protein